MSMLVLLVSILEAVGIGFYLFKTSKKLNAGSQSVFDMLSDEVGQKRKIREALVQFEGEMVEPTELKTAAKSYLIARESLKAERGRVTITQAELETIEVRLRELDEIARELAASMTETKEELKILQRKEGELSTKNEQLKAQISDSVSKMDAIMSDIEMSAQMQEHIIRMKSEIVKAEEQTETLLGQITAGNEQYFILKKRYDALDIEYAQLYEKFSEQQGS
jgi:chromosome segregation ATPase